MFVNTGEYGLVEGRMGLWAHVSYHLPPSPLDTVANTEKGDKKVGLYLFIAFQLRLRVEEEEEEEGKNIIKWEENICKEGG